MEENQMIQITNAHGGFPNHAYDREPEPASVVLTDGEYGNAWQRYFSDGFWHRGKHVRTWTQLLRERNMWLIYDAPVRGAALPGCRACEISGAICYNHREVSA